MAEHFNADDSDHSSSAIACACGQTARYAGRRPKTFTTLLGPLTLERAYYHCAACRRGSCPRDRALGLQDTSLSPATTRLVGLTAAEVSFAKASELLAALAGIDVETRQVERTAEALGREVACDERAGPEQTAPASAPTMYLGLDGTGVPVRPAEVDGRRGKQPDGSAKTREVKLVTVWTAEGRDPQGRPRRDPGSVSYNAAVIVKLDTQRLQTLDQVREFLAGSRPLDLQLETRAEAYAFVAETLQRFDYSRRGKADKGLIRRFLNKVTGLSRAQVTRLLHQHRTTGAIADRRRPRHPFPRRYTKADIGLLAEVDALHGTLSGPATRKLCVRALQLFGDRRFERLAAISNGHLYNLRHSTSYQRRRGTMPAPTRPVHIAIGERRRPQPFGQPGYLRVDSVHQGDLDGIKGLYHLNLVDEVTQFQFVGSVERIDTPCLAPVLEALLRAFPFNVRGFHTDNGSEFINHKIVARLQALHIDEFTKSRPRRSNDNALVESKNGSVIRKHLGYGHISSRYAERVNAFTQQVLSPYLNFHRPCLFPVDEVDAKGRVRKRYPHANVMTPYEKLKSLPNAAACLKLGTSFDQLDAVAAAMSDSDAARALNQARDRLFASIDPAA